MKIAKQALLWLGITGVLAGCVNLPDKADDGYEDAVGAISISTPHFVPLETSVAGDKALNFGNLRSETNLWNLVERPSLGISDLLYRRTELNLAVKLAGSIEVKTAQDISQTIGGVTTNFSNATNTTSHATPEVPTANRAANATDEAVRNQLVKLLERSPNSFHLPPDQIASLVAAYKTYMVNLEEYLNMEGVDFGFQGSQGSTVPYYLPYKVYFTVSTTPGWYSRHHQHDAVAELTLQPSQTNNLGISIVAAMPAETAQAIDEFAAAFKSLIFSLAAEGQYGPLAGSGKFENVLEKAHRVEGLRTEKLITVGFPAANKLSIRFRPAANSSKEGRVLDSVAKPMMALVMVKSEPPRKPESTKQNHDSASLLTATAVPDKAYVELTTNTVIDVTAVASTNRAITTNLFLNTIKITDVLSIPTLSKAETSTNTVVVTNTFFATNVVAVPIPVASDSIPTLSGGYFAPAGYFNNGKWKAPRSFGFAFDSTKRLRVSDVPGSVSIPPWLGDFRKPLRIVEGAGLYYTDFSEVIKYQFFQGRTESDLAEAQKASEEVAAKIKAAQAEVEKLKEAVKTTEAALAAIAAKLKEKPSATECAELKNQRTKLQATLKEQGEARDKKEADLTAPKGELVSLKGKIGALQAEHKLQATAIATNLARALSCANATVRVKIDAPRRLLSEERTWYSTPNIDITAYFNGKAVMTNTVTGPGDYLLNLDCLNLTGLCPTTNCANVPEAWLTVSAMMYATNTTKTLRGAVATNVVIIPSLRSASASKAEPSKPQTTNAATNAPTGNVLQISLEQAKITLDGKPAPTKSDK